MMGEDRLELAAGVFRVLSQTSSLELCQWLFSNRPTSQKDLADRFGISQPAIANRLLKLRQAGLVGFQKDGRREIAFLIKSEEVQTARQLLEELRKVALRSKGKPKPVDPNLERLLTTTFGALSGINRLCLCALLTKGELGNEELVKGLRISQALVSTHLRVLLDAGLVRLRQCPSNLSLHYYSLIYSVGVMRAIEFLNQIIRRGRDPNRYQIDPASLLKKQRRQPPSIKKGSSGGFSPPDYLPNPPADKEKSLYICYQGFCRDARTDGREMPTLKMDEFLAGRACLDWRQRQRWDQFYVRGYQAVKDEMIRDGFLKLL